MPARPDVIDEDLEPFAGELTSQFDIEDALVSGDFADVRAAGGRFMRSRLDRAVLTGSRLRSVALVDVVALRLRAVGRRLDQRAAAPGGLRGHARRRHRCSPTPSSTTSSSATAS